jgi:hypothetical protein
VTLMVALTNNVRWPPLLARTVKRHSGALNTGWGLPSITPAVQKGKVAQWHGIFHCRASAPPSQDKQPAPQLAIPHNLR